MPLVKAKCLVSAWDGIACGLYVPGKGPLEGGLYEIDSDWEHLNKMTTPTGDYVFQYPGHEGKAPGFDKKPQAVPSARVEPVAEIKTQDKRKLPLSPERRENLKKAQAAAREAKMAKLEAAAA